MISQGGTNPVYCNGLAYNESDSTITILLTAKEVRLMSSSHQATSYQTILFRVSDSGSVQDGRQISLNKATTGTISASTSNFNILKRYGNYFIWSGHSYGFYTKYSSTVSFVTSSTQRYNAYTYKYLWDKDESYKCYPEYDITINTDIRAACNLFACFTNQ